METAIKRAIEGGYTTEKTIWVTKLGGLKNLVHPADILLDPEFWKCLSKGCGWQDIYSGDDEGNDYELIQWQYRWHELIDHLAENKDVDSFFNKILK